MIEKFLFLLAIPIIAVLLGRLVSFLMRERVQSPEEELLRQADVFKNDADAVKADLLAKIKSHWAIR